jgi:hypothetical protein
VRQIEERWHDPGSGPGCMVRVYTYGPADPEVAYRQILTHGTTCQTCRAVDEDGKATSECSTARRLHLAWRMAKRQAEAAETPAAG